MERRVSPLMLVGAWEIANRLGLSRQRVQQLADGDGFPEPFQQLRMGRIWWAHDIEDWIARRNGTPPNPLDHHDDRARCLALQLADCLAEHGQDATDCVSENRSRL